MKSYLFLLFAAVLLSAVAASAQTPKPNLILELGVAADKNLDGIYRQFGEGYRKLDPVQVAGLYTGTAAYLAPGAEVQTGRKTILGIFTGFFDSVRKQNGTVEISFRILQRQVDTNLAYDVGVYTLASTDAKGQVRQSSGKFIVVAKREPDGVWRFQVDGYNDLPNTSR